MDALLKSGRKECPSCKRKGLGYARHQHAFGYKDHERAACRYCGKTFKIRQPANTDGRG